jgi:hypothetical protein
MLTLISILTEYRYNESPDAKEREIENDEQPTTSEERDHSVAHLLAAGHLGSLLRFKVLVRDECADEQKTPL